MARERKKLLDDFIIPSLNSGKYKNKLFWLDKEKGMFRLFWSHKNAAKWTVQDTQVFQDWDELKGRENTQTHSYYMCAKQRFRAALHKLKPHVRSIEPKGKYYRDFQLVADMNKRPTQISSRPKCRVTKKTRPSAIPTSVIRKNTSYIAKSLSEDQTSSSPGPSFHTPDDQKIIEQYSTSMEKLHQLRKSRRYETMIQDEVTPQKINTVHKISVLRENSSISRNSHIAHQPVPVYCSYKQFFSRHPPTIQDCPEVFLSKIYTGPENVPQGKDDIQSSRFSADEEDACSGILNLSVKSDAKLHHQADRRMN